MSNNIYLKVPNNEEEYDDNTDKDSASGMIDELELEEETPGTKTSLNLDSEEDEEEIFNSRFQTRQRPAAPFQSKEQSDILTHPDEFCEDLYKYYQKKGWWCILSEKILNIIQIYVIVSISFAVLIFINYRDLLSCKMAECGNINFFVWPENSFATYLLMTIHFLLYIGALVIAVKDLLRLIDYYKVHKYVVNDLRLHVGQVQTMKWTDFLEIVVNHSRNEKKLFYKNHNKLEITNRIMRIENIMIELISNDVLTMKLHRWGGNVLSKSLVKNLKHILSSLRYYDNSTGLKLDDPGYFRSTIVKTGMYNLLLSPFIAYYIFVNTVLKYAANLKKGNLNFLTLKRWSNFAKWKFRCFNELPHDFTIRLNTSLEPAKEYFSAFPFYGFSIFAKGLVNISSALIAVLIFISFLKNAALLYINILGINLLYWMGILFMIWATSSSYVLPGNENVVDPEIAMQKLIKIVYTDPDEWIKYPESPRTFNSFCTYFQKSYKYFFHEILSIFVVPIYLIFVMSGDSEKILKHILSNMYVHEVVGDIIRFSNFSENSPKIQDDKSSDDEYGSVTPLSNNEKIMKKMLASQITFSINNSSTPNDGFETALLAELEDTN